jgi:hypothetical protein
MDTRARQAEAQHAMLDVLPPVARRGPVRDGVVDTRVVNGLTLITLAGELDLSQAPALHRALIPAPAASLPDLAIDLRRVEFMDCSVIGALMRGQPHHHRRRRMPPPHRPAARNRQAHPTLRTRWCLLRPRRQDGRHHHLHAPHQSNPRPSIPLADHVFVSGLDLMAIGRRPGRWSGPLVG